MDGSAEILKENSTAQNWSSSAETAVTEFRVLSILSLSHLSNVARLPSRWHRPRIDSIADQPTHASPLKRQRRRGHSTDTASL
jgi:hypothetical protein